VPIAHRDIAFIDAAPPDPGAPPLARFVPSRVIANRYVQTIIPFVYRRAVQAPLERERWETPDGDFVDVDLARPEGPPRALALVLHGLEGSSRARYVLGAIERLTAGGVLALAPNFRACSGELNRLPRLYHCGDSDELRFLVAEALRRRPDLPLVLLGFSAGGNVLVKWLAEEGAAVPAALRASAAVSVPFDLAAVARWNDRLRHKLIREFFLRTLRAKALLKAERHPGVLDPCAVRRASTFCAFDHDVTAALHGFASGEDYWRRASAGPLIGGVRAPLLVLAAEDDPIVPSLVIPREAIARNPHVSLETTPRGGHVGFVAGSPLRPRFFAEERATEFLLERIGRG
jgi:hypothetical protein